MDGERLGRAVLVRIDGGGSPVYMNVRNSELAQAKADVAAIGGSIEVLGPARPDMPLVPWADASPEAWRRDRT